MAQIVFIVVVSVFYCIYRYRFYILIEVSFF